MSWWNAVGRENAKEFYENNRVIERCIFCGQEKEIKTVMSICFSEHEVESGAMCKDCYAANAKSGSLLFLSCSNFSNVLSFSDFIL